jgi:proliferating cell nuclear antigen
MNIEIVDPARAEKFCNLFQHVKLFTEHINITFHEDRMYLQTMDSSRISIFEIYLPNEWFNTYDFTHNESIHLGLNANILFKVLNTRDKQQNLQMVFDPDQSDKLIINFVSENKKIFDKHFEIPLMDLDVDLLNIPEFESDADIMLPSSNFAEIINQLQIFGDTIEFKCTEELIQLCSISPESGKMMADIDIDELTSYSITEDNTMSVSFSLSRLHNICMYNKMSKEVEILLTDSYPMKITYQLDDADDAKMVFYLAPKISDN